MNQVLQYLEEVRHWWEGYAYPVQSSAMQFDLAINVFVVMLVFMLWLRYFQGRGAPLWVPLLSTVCAVVVITAPLHLQRSYYGEMDYRCQYYMKGKLDYQLMGITSFVSDTSDPLGPMVVVLVVRANERWGDDPHMCGVLEGDESTRQLIDDIYAALDSQPFSPGLISFTFGDGVDKPSVTFRKDDIPNDKGPPEVADQDA